MTSDWVRRSRVGVSAEAVAGAWARQEGAAHGSVVVIDHEVAGRLRGGTPAAGGSLAVIVRVELALRAHDRLWVAAQVAATRAISTVSANMTVRAGWPDPVEIQGAPAAFVNVTCQLGPGRIELAIIALRAADASLLPSAECFRNEVLVAVDLAVNDFDLLACEHTDLSAVQGRAVRVFLLPRGETRGTVTGVGPDGQLRIETSTGMVELLDASSVRRVETA